MSSAYPQLQTWRAVGDFDFLCDSQQAVRFFTRRVDRQEETLRTLEEYFGDEIPLSRYGIFSALVSLNEEGSLVVDDSYNIEDLFRLTEAYMKKHGLLTNVFSQRDISSE